MGIGTGFWSQVLPNVKRTSQTLEKWKGKRIGVDFSIWVHKAQNRKEAIFSFSITPRYAPDAVYEACKQKICCLLRQDIVPVLVFDGKRHTMKAPVHKKREKIRSDARTKLDALAKSEFWAERSMVV